MQTLPYHKQIPYKQQLKMYKDKPQSFKQKEKSRIQF